MSNVWFIADTHFGHNRLAQGGFGEKSARPIFPSAREHDEWLMDLWNSTVRKRDVVWVLGDLAVNGVRLLSVFPRLKGHKYVVLGNHDKYSARTYLDAGFADRIGGAVPYRSAILTHVPVHPSQLEFRFKYNIHGHIHNPSKYPDLTPETGYYNVNVCATGGLTNYDEIEARFQEIRKRTCYFKGWDHGVKD